MLEGQLSEEVVEEWTSYVAELAETWAEVVELHIVLRHPQQTDAAVLVDTSEC